MNNQIDLRCALNSINGGDSDRKEQSNKTSPEDTVHLPEKFRLSDYEDDADDSGFCCPCCLVR